VGELAKAEEAEWYVTKYYKKYAAVAIKAIDQFKIKDVIEIGCGTGLIPTELPENINYLGVDKNPTFLKWARDKNNPNRKFIQEDIRTLTVDKPYDLVICCAVLKHFSLTEWDQIVKKVLSLGNRGLIEMQVAASDIDNGTAFHHVFVSQSRLERAIALADHKYIEETILYQDSFLTSKIVLTERSHAV
jgi:trans-aconitate methyltransferase